MSPLKQIYFGENSYALIIPVDNVANKNLSQN